MLTNSKCPARVDPARCTVVMGAVKRFVVVVTDIAESAAPVGHLSGGCSKPPTASTSTPSSAVVEGSGRAFMNGLHGAAVLAGVLCLIGAAVAAIGVRHNRHAPAPG